MSDPEVIQNTDRPLSGSKYPTAGFIDVIALWQESAREKNTARDRAENTESKNDNKPVNAWTVAGEVRDGINRLSLTSEYKVNDADFKKANPDSDPDKPDTTGSFNLKHPTTGEVDGGWKIKQRTQDGYVVLSKDYSVDVQARRDHSGVLEAMPGIPDSFIKSLQTKLDQLPPNVVSSLQRHGYKIVAAGTIPDAMPGLAKLTPRGWPADTKFINSDGTHDDVSKRIIAPMRYINETDLEPVLRENVVTHQIGHALDFAHGFLSASPEFIEAYNKDMALLQQTRLKGSPIVKYLSQPEGVGRQETFASIFGLVTTGPENQSDRKFFQENFKNVIRVVEKQVRDLR